MFILLPRSPRDEQPSDLHSLIRSALVSQSAAGMVVPGMARSRDSGRPAYRAASGADPSLPKEVDRMYESWQHGTQGPDDTWWLAAGYAAIGRLGLASDLLHQALRRYPDDVQLLHLDAITAWQLSEFDRSEHALNRILNLAPTDSTALFNLALVQLETDRTDAAASILRRLAAGEGNTVFQRRSRELLNEFKLLH